MRIELTGMRRGSSLATFATRSSSARTRMEPPWAAHPLSLGTASSPAGIEGQMIPSRHRWTHPKIRQGIELVLEGLRECDEPPLAAEGYRSLVAELGRLRGRDLFLPYLSSGRGCGARVRLADGRSVLDFALGIGVHFFGHGDPDLIRTALEAALEDTAMQGNLQMGTVLLE